MRDNLRLLKSPVKAQLIRSNDIDFSSLGRSKSEPGSTKDKARSAAHTPSNNNNSHRRGLSQASQASDSSDEAKKSTKRSRSRSRAFTFGRSSSKKPKGGAAGGGDVDKEGSASVAAAGLGKLLPKSPSMVSLHHHRNSRSNSMADGGGAGSPSAPEDFVAYLRSEQNPEKVEVGRVHKLRQVLRNETVAWVETFIKLGGMMEIVDLLHRIMKIEWR